MQATKGCQVVAVQVTAWAKKRFDEAYSADEDLEEVQRRQHSISGLDLSAARILMLGEVQLPPQKGVLWLEQRDAAAEWGQLSPGLVVLASHNSQVPLHSHSASTHGLCSP
jgi:hypothetical protein